MEQHDWPDFDLGKDETEGPAFFWKNPWKNGKREKIASLWWPEHPPEATEAVEVLFDNLRLVYGEEKSPYAEDLQQIAEALNMPFAPGRKVVARVRELVAITALFQGHDVPV